MEKQIAELLEQIPASKIIDYDYILTEQDEKNAIAHEVNILKTAAERKAKGLKSKQEINQLLKTDFESKLNKAEIFERYNLLKHRQNDNELKRIEKIEYETNRRNEIKLQWNYGKFYREIKNHFENKTGSFIFNDVNKHFIMSICYFLANSDRFNDVLGLSLSKGLLVAGNTGIGKTETIKAIKDNALNPIAIYSMIEITDFVKKEGDFNLRLGQKIICLDDVGTEQPTVKHYGTEISWFKDFIETYYLDKQPFNKLIITTNLTGEEIEERYGRRVRSRMREMFNQISLKGEDLRK